MHRRVTVLVLVSVCLCVCLSVTTLAAPSFVYTLFKGRRRECQPVSGCMGLKAGFVIGFSWLTCGFLKKPFVQLWRENMLMSICLPPPPMALMQQPLPEFSTTEPSNVL